MDALVLEDAYVRANGVRLHVVMAGPEDGPPVILLHGFPEAWLCWENQIRALAEAGYRVWAPDLRGYNLSEKPKGISAYRMETIAKDVAGLIEAMGHEQAVVVGHDWGAMAAWCTTIFHPECVSKLVILNVPHPAAVPIVARKHPSQFLKSLYFFFFQIPRLPEAMLSANHFAALKRGLTRSSRPGTYTNADLARYEEAWSQPGALTAMLNWYRAFIQKAPKLPEDVRIHVPTLIVWGVQDIALHPALAPTSAGFCDDVQLVLIEEASHWVQHEEPTQVNEAILGFLR